MDSRKALLKIIHKVGSQAELARKVGVSRSYVYDWLNERGTIPPRLVKKLVALSEGEVTERDLRPDIFYDYNPHEKKELRVACG